MRRVYTAMDVDKDPDTRRFPFLPENADHYTWRTYVLDFMHLQDTLFVFIVSQH